MKPMPKPQSWRESNPTYETLPPRVSRIRVDPCDPNSRTVEVVEIDAGKWWDYEQHLAAMKSKKR